jgi:deoxyribodipyrimidine photo-lyase
MFIIRELNAEMPAKVDVPYYAVDSSCIVPMSMLGKREFAAYTIRPKIHRLLPKFFRAPDRLQVKQRYLASPPDFHVNVTDADIPELVRSSDIDHSVPPSISFDGGRLRAEKLLRYFLENNLKRFDRDRNEPAEHATSHLSPYLHFGQISSLEVGLAVKEYAGTHHLMADGYFEELACIGVRRYSNGRKTYQDAVDFMIDTHGRYALDGRDPNTHTNVLWCFGLHDRAWGERSIFGKIRYMSGASTKRKTNAKAYIEEIAELERTGKDPFRVV